MSDPDQDGKCNFCGEPIDETKDERNVDNTWIKCSKWKIWQRIKDIKRNAQ